MKTKHEQWQAHNVGATVTRIALAGVLLWNGVLQVDLLYLCCNYSRAASQAASCTLSVLLFHKIRWSSQPRVAPG